MIDIKFLRENPEVVKENIKKKFQDHKLPLVDEVIVLDARRRILDLQRTNADLERRVLELENENEELQEKLNDEIAKNGDIKSGTEFLLSDLKRKAEYTKKLLEERQGEGKNE